MPDQSRLSATLCDQPLAVIETPRLRLRGRIPDDAYELFPAMSDIELMRWWSRPPFTSISELQECFSPHANSRWREWAVTRKASDSPIGFVAVGQRREGVSEIGYLLAREAHGQGIAQEALTGLLTLLVEEGQRRVFADTDPDNAGSIKLLKRLGFRLEGHLRQEWHTHIGIRDSLVFGLLADEWKP